MSEAFEWHTERHGLKIRRLRVTRSETVAPGMQRVTLSGDDLVGFTAPAPADHVKLFFPGPDGTIVHPTLVDDRPQRPEHGTVISRDYTPAGFREHGESGAPEIDLDFYLHGAGGAAGTGGAADAAHDAPAANWAANAAPGDELVVAGPRGSHLPPRDIDSLLIIADETALPAARRWIAAYPDAPVTCLLTLSSAATATYLDEVSEREHLSTQLFSGHDAAGCLEGALRSSSITERTLVFLAGEATTLVPLRRYLRRELGLPKEQVDAHGYWKRGEANLDHHAPIDPSDPD